MNIVEVRKDHLYFSGWIDDWNAVTGLTAIVNLQIETIDQPPGTLWLDKVLLWCPIYDYPEAQESFAVGVEWLDTIVDMVAALYKHGHKILIHCTMGENRSGLVTAALLMKLEGKKADEALADIRIGKPTAVWNRVWQRKLAEYEAKLYANTHS